MKDAYSFDLDAASAEAAYDTMFLAYLRTFRRMGLTAIPMQADTGPIGGNLSHEFQILAKTGESEVHFDAAFEAIDFAADDLSVADLKTLYAAADDKHDPATCPVPAERLRSGRGIEVGHIFYLGTKYSEPMGATVIGPDGATQPVHMGCYGIGVSRLVGALIEANHDDKGIIWPEAVAPFRVGIVDLRPDDALSHGLAEQLYERLQRAGVEVLLDERDERAGAKFATMELIGLPWTVTVGPRGAKQGLVELKSRASGETVELDPEALVQRLAG
jgi:prolyl-tRNA synthetase